MDFGIKTVKVQSYAIRLGEESKSPNVREAAESLTEAILSYRYPMIPSQTYDHRWSEAGLVSCINCPTVIQYADSEEDYKK